MKLQSLLHTMNDLFDQVWAEKWRFFATFFVVFTLSYLVLMALDWLPEEPATPATPATGLAVTESAEGVTVAQEAAATDTVAAPERQPAARGSAAAPVPTTEVAAPVEERQVAPSAVVAEAALPQTLHIPRLGRTVTVLNPTSRAIADLDAALLEGVVRHPDAATMTQEGNVFILGHSSYLPQVRNQNFQAFNGIQNLEWGDTIEVHTAGAVYEYRVDRVYQARAQEVTVPIAGTGHKLTLATCNSFGSVDDRYIVEATRVGVSTNG